MRMRAAGDSFGWNIENRVEWFTECIMSVPAQEG